MADPGRGLKVQGGDLAMVGGSPAFVSGRDAIAQAVQARLLTFRGEWFLDPSIGVPYFDQVLGKKAPRLDTVRAVLSKEILSVPGVIGVPEITVSIDSASRSLTGSFRATTASGDVTGSIG